MTTLQHIRAVIFDWAGTMVDHGSLAPMGAFVEAFARFGIELAIEEARGPMGMAKRPHIAALMALPRIRQQWRHRYNREPSGVDVDELYKVFVPLNVAVAARYAQLVPGAAETAGALRALGVKIGSSTGYTREIMAEILPVAAAQGYAPDCLVCTGDTSEGRPAPFMMYRAFLDLQVSPAWACIKVDDTEVGIAEGLAAGAWSIGVAVTGNCFGLNLEDTRALAPDRFAERRAIARDRLLAAGAHLVIDGVADLLPCIHAIEGRLARGERP